jgi:hypothetical protein
MGVYAQQAKYFNSINCTACPRDAFLTDLKEDITKFQEAGDQIIIMLDGNKDMRRGPLSQFSPPYIKEKSSYSGTEIVLHLHTEETQENSQLMAFGPQIAWILFLVAT